MAMVICNVLHGDSNLCESLWLINNYLPPEVHD